MSHKEPNEPPDSFDAMTPEWNLHAADGSVTPAENEEPDADLSTQELEQLYRQALNAVEVADAVESQLGLDGEQTSPQPSNEESPAPPTGSSSPAPKIQPRQILEAALFVGGTNLTTKKLGRLLGEDVSSEKVEAEIEALQQLYARQNRPYQIHFGEGGYRLELNPEFERIRNRVYGLGPREVKLSQEALEVLAMIAYRQPVARQALLEKGPRNAGSILNQLLRRELIVLERTGESRHDVQYSTTDRFLQVFGIADLKHLPQPDDLTFK
jgi:segregation and condensation protein B